MNKVIFESASRAVATYVSAAFTTQGFPGGRFFIDVSVHNGGSVTPKVQVLDQLSGNWVDLPGAAFAAVSGSNQTKQLTVCPGVAETANEAVSDALGNTCRISAAVGVAAVTFSMSVDLVR